MKWEVAPSRLERRDIGHDEEEDWARKPLAYRPGNDRWADGLNGGGETLTTRSELVPSSPPRCI